MKYALFCVFDAKRAFCFFEEKADFYEKADFCKRYLTHDVSGGKKKEETKMSETTNKAANKKQGKKIVLAVAVLAVVAILFGVIYTKFSPKASAGAKEIVLTVTDDKEETTTYTLNTDAEYLRQALEEAKAQGLTVEGTESEYGLVIETVNGLTADFNTDGAYWAIFVNGEYGNYGVDEQPVADKDTYALVYTAGQ